MKSVFSLNSYKKIMQTHLLDEGRRGQLSRAAEFLNCQPSFLSRVIGSEIHITPDQAFLLSVFWNLPADEQEYFQKLVDYERAADSKYRASLELKIQEIRKNHESLQKRMKKPEFSLLEQQAQYFSSWQWSAIHFLTSIPEYQTARQISERLGLPEKAVLPYLKKLAAYGMVRQDKERWKYLSGQFHLPRNSPFVLLHHQNWRSRASLNAQEIENDSVHFTNVFTLSHEDFTRIKELIINFIADAERIGRPSNPEEAVALTCDFFKI